MKNAHIISGTIAVLGTGRIHFPAFGRSVASGVR